MLLRSGRAAVGVAFILAALVLVGWATGTERLTRIHPIWPPMTPWTAISLGALGVAILFQSGSPPPFRRWLGRGTAVLAGVTSTVFLAEYATRRAIGIDQLWFGQAVATVHSSWPGRPSPATAVSVVFLAGAIALMGVERRPVRLIRLGCLVVAAATTWVVSLAYLFRAIALVNTEPSTGMAAATALGLLLLLAAAVLVQPGRNPVAWILSQPNRGVLMWLAGVFAGFPVVLALSRLAFAGLGFGADEAVTLSTAVGTVAAGLIAFSLARRQQQLLESIESDRALLRASAESMLDPQVLLEAVRDAAGRVVDFRYITVNYAACAYLGLEAEDLLGHCQLEFLPQLEESGLHGRYRQCLLDGVALVLNDFSYFNEIIDDARRYDIRATRAGADLICLTWTDVTERFRNAHRLAESEQRYRLLAENSADIVCHVRDGKWVWVSPSIEPVLDAPAEFWPGRDVFEIVPPEDVPTNAARLATVVAGGTVQERIRVISVQGTTHWLDVHAKPFLDSEGRQDGITAALRLIDDEVAAEQAAAEARRQRAEADARYRRLIENSAVPTSLNTADGRFVLVNDAMCDFLGYETETLLTKTWPELIAPEYLAESEAAIADLLAGRRDSYRARKQYIHADGHRAWGDLSISPMFDQSGKVESLIRQIVDITEQVESRQRLEEARLRRAEADALARGLIDNSIVATALTTLDGRLTRFNQAFCDLVGYDAGTLGQMTWQEITAAEFLAADLGAIPGIISGAIPIYRVRKQFLHSAGHRVWGDMSASVLRKANGDPQYLIGQILDITSEVESREQLEQARRRQAEADTRFRRSMDNAAIGMCLITPEGRFEEVNEALCELFGYDAETLKQKTWQELTAPDYLEADLELADDVLEGRRDSYRMLKQYIRADGKRIWGNLSVSCVRDEHGRVETFVSQIADVTAEVEANERVDRLNQRLTAEIRSAADYVASILPGRLSGDVTVSSRYLPSRELGGDCFDYGWIDDDHLMVYLIDVSGHGIEPALLAVSLQNILRSGTLGIETLLAPGAVLSELNRLFQMEQQHEHYFTMWYGIYQKSSRMLRYASAGAPTTLAFTATAGDLTMVELPTMSLPAGIFEDTEFTTESYRVPIGCRMLLYSDGASEQIFASGRQLSPKEFKTLVAQVAATPNWTLDSLVRKLRKLTLGHAFEDDCSLIQLAFDDGSPRRKEKGSSS